jgi:hypothetical protein
MAVSADAGVYFPRRKDPIRAYLRSWLFQQTPGSNSLAAWIQPQATPNAETNPETVKEPP